MTRKSEKFQLVQELEPLTEFFKNFLRKNDFFHKIINNWKTIKDR